MKNEPVAWMDEETGCFVYSQYDYKDLDEHGKDGLIPLYIHPVNPKYDPETGEPLIDGYPLFSGLTHPVKEHFEDEPQAEELHEILQSNAELTDEEIKSCWNWETDCQEWAIEFARAILRKAKEK